MTPETIAELRRRHAALTPFALRFLSGGPGGEPFIALACEDGTPLPEPAFDAVLLFAELAAAELPAILDAAAERDALTDERDSLSWQVEALRAERDARSAERDALAAKLGAVRALHRPVGIYDECECSDEAKAEGHEDVEEVGLTCNRMYTVCAECCRDDVYQTEDCANYHDHKPDEAHHCPTIRALDESEANK